MHLLQLAVWLFLYLLTTAITVFCITLSSIQALFNSLTFLHYISIIYYTYKSIKNVIKTKYQHSLSHSLMSALSWCRAPMEICLISGLSKSCIKEVEMCLQADMQAVWATLPCKRHRESESERDEVSKAPSANYRRLWIRT